MIIWLFVVLLDLIGRKTCFVCYLGDEMTVLYRDIEALGKLLGNSLAAASELSTY